MVLWWRDVIREAKGGYHTTPVQQGILIGFLLFLLSEVMLFVSFFWAFFHSSLSPNVELALWPHDVSIGLMAVHDTRDSNLFNFLMLLTVLLGGLFLFLQYNEYYNGIQYYLVHLSKYFEYSCCLL